MNVKEFVEGLKEKGVPEGDIKGILEKIVSDINAYLGSEDKAPEEGEKAPEAAETPEDKEKRVFGI